MNITLPKKFFYKGKASYPYSSGYAKVENGTLYIYGNIKFSNLMYKITRCLKGRTCSYCGKELTKSQLTLDHVIPRDFGGPTIPNNLVPACADCNSRKSNLPLEDLKIYRTLTDHRERHHFKKSVYERQERIRYLKGFSLPPDWYDEHFSLREITATIVLAPYSHGKRDIELENFYKKYHHFPSPLLVDRNGFLLDGFKTLMFARNAGIEHVPVIVLENVERILKDKANKKP